MGSIDTFILGLLFTRGNAKVAGAIAGTGVITKIFLYYFHERMWSFSRWGLRDARPGEIPGPQEEELFDPVPPRS